MIKNLEWHSKSEKLNIPTKFSAQILANTKQIFVNIEEYYTKENLVAVFQGVLADIIKHYLGVFENLAIENKTAAARYLFINKTVKKTQKLSRIKVFP